MGGRTVIKKSNLRGPAQLGRSAHLARRPGRSRARARALRAPAAGHTRAACSEHTNVYDKKPKIRTNSHRSPYNSAYPLDH
eukprot:7055006-Prymnesium_polylepis.1